MPVEYLMWAPLVATSLALYVTLAAGALFSIAQSDWVPLSSRRVWVVVVVLLPVAGAVLWLAASHLHTAAGRGDAGTVPELQPNADGYEGMPEEKLLIQAEIEHSPSPIPDMPGQGETQA